ncbi:MAG TPA: Ppx/GppA family phosphatase [Actinomycetota bacterium]|nr:Ppx/GppA family phosphatase [Actinomycetota bacterium]
MPKVIPRWEWRTFGASFGAAEDAFAGLPPGQVQESDELYLLAGSENNVKVRDDLMDIKVLREVDAEGLERWEPVMKAGFPLSTADASHVCEALSLASPRAGDDYTLDRFVAELVEPSGSVRPVRVHKRRARYTVGGCMAELSDIGAGGRSTRTIAIESEDPAAVIAAVRDVGLDGYVNTSYPVGLARLVDGEDPRYAVIDVGTNSVKFHIGERDAGGSWRAIVDRAELTRLGEGLQDAGVISSEPLGRTVTAIAGMAQEAKRHGVTAIVAVGTAGLRMAGNREDVVAAIRSDAGVGVDVIAGEEEGRLAYLAVQAGLGLGEGPLVVFDTGGGSTQFTFGRGAEVDERFSLEVGAVRYTERFGLDGEVSLEVLDEAFAAISDDLSRIDDRQAPDALVGMGGAITNITAVKHGLATYDPDVVQGTVLDRAEIDRQIELFRARAAEDRRAIVGLQPKRADVILAGACIVRTVMEKLDQQALTVSDRGLRHGVLIDRFGA